MIEGERERGNERGSQRERESGGGAEMSAKSGRSRRGSSTTLAYRFACVLSYIEVKVQWD